MLKIFLVTMYVSLAAATGVVCRANQDMRYDFTDCEGTKKHTANVFFYYPRSFNCDMARSDPLPPFLTDVPCHHLCENNGTYTTFKVDE